jgi:hypothetical protein
VGVIQETLLISSQQSAMLKAKYAQLNSFLDFDAICELFTSHCSVSQLLGVDRAELWNELALNTCVILAAICSRGEICRRNPARDALARSSK